MQDRAGGHSTARSAASHALRTVRDARQSERRRAGPRAENKHDYFHFDAVHHAMNSERSGKTYRWRTDQGQGGTRRPRPTKIDFVLADTTPRVRQPRSGRGRKQSRRWQAAWAGAPHRARLGRAQRRSYFVCDTILRYGLGDFSPADTFAASSFSPSRR